MKILLATETYFPQLSGAVVAVNSLAAELVRQGHMVYVFAPSQGGKFRRERSKDGFIVYRFPSIPNPFKKKTRMVVSQYKRVSSAFAEVNPDIVHIHSPSGVPVAVQKVARKAGVPVIATHHFSLEFILIYFKLFGLTGLTRRALIVYLNRIYRNCDILTCPSESIRRVLMRNGIKVPIRVISNGINLDAFTPLPAGVARKIPDDVPSVLCVGRVDKDKNLDVLLEAIPLVIAKKPARFIIAGTGNYLRRARAWVQAHDLTDWVVFTGKVPHGSELMHHLYRESDLFVIPSNIETQGVVVMEAMASELPVVASRSGALPELVEHGQTGYLAIPDSPEDFAFRIVQLLQDPDKSVQMGKVGREALTFHALPLIVEQYVQLYRSVERA